MKTFKEYVKLKETDAIYDPKVKPKTFNWWGAPGSTGVSIEGDPIKPKSNKKKKHG